MGITINAGTADDGTNLNTVSAASATATVLNLAAYTWTGTAGDNNWNTAGNWSTAAVPGPGDTAIFNSNCTDCNFTLNSAVTVGGIDIQSTYAGFFTHNSGTLTVQSNGFSIDGGNFNSNGGTIFVQGDMTISGGNFTKSSGNLDLSGNVAFTSGTINLNGSEMHITGATGTSIESHVQIPHLFLESTVAAGVTVSGGVDLLVQNLTLNGGAAAQLQSTSAEKIRVSGNLTATNWGGGDTTIMLNGAGSQTVTGNAGARLPSLQISSSSGSVTFSGNIEIARNFTYSLGTVNTSSATFKFVGPDPAIIDTSPSMDFYDLNLNKSGDITISGTAFASSHLLVDMFSSATINTGFVEVDGGIDIQNASPGSATLSIVGLSSQSINYTATNYPFANTIVNKSTGDLNLISDLPISDVGQDLTIQNGTVQMAGKNLDVADILDLGASATMIKDCGALTWGTKTGSGTIKPFQDTTININDVVVDENQTATLSVTLSAGVCAPVAFKWSTADGTATIADNDFTSYSNIVELFAPSSTGPISIIVPINDDSNAEPAEYFNVNLSDVTTGVTLGDLSGRVDVNESDQPTNDLVISNLLVTGASPTGFTVRVDYTNDADNDGSATLWYCNNTDSPGCNPESGSSPPILDYTTYFEATVSGLSDPDNPGDTFNVRVVANDPDGFNGPLDSTATLQLPPPGTFKTLGVTYGLDTTPDGLLTDGIGQATVKIHWEPSSGANDYDVAVKNSSFGVICSGNFAAPALNGMVSGCSNFTDATDYYVEVTANNGGGATTAQIGDFPFRTVLASTGGFHILGVTSEGTDKSPDSFMEDGSNLTLHWEPAVGATAYDIQIKENNAPICGTSTPINVGSNITKHTIASCPGAAGGVLTMHVSAISGGSYPAANDGMEFFVATNAGMNNFNILGVRDGSTDTRDDNWFNGADHATELMVNWQHSTGYDHYELSIRDAANLVDICGPIDTGANNNANLPMEGCNLNLDTSYTLRLYAINAAGEAKAPMNNGFRFRIGPMQCPAGYVRVPYNDDYAFHEDFCVMKWEAKLLYDSDADGDFSEEVVVADGNASNIGMYDYFVQVSNRHRFKPVSRPEGRPWVYIRRGGTTNEGAIEACSALGETHFSLISNNQWQVAARNIEQVASNWSGLSYGVGFLNVGNITNTPNQSCDGLTSNVFGGSCSTSGGSHETFRVHTLTNSEDIWDLGGNVKEWVSTNNTVATYTASATNTVALTSMKKLWFGPLYSPTYSSPSDPGAIGNLGRTGQHYTFISGIDYIQRGSKFDSGNASGIFSSYVQNLNASVTTGFRCSWRP
ncbi:MAG: hypothetical protein KDD59_13325 [Bdellovibrionales bacterium]|nr:hypothetical protein [Bdellovibrionales bacterium]